MDIDDSMCEVGGTRFLKIVDRRPLIMPSKLRLGNFVMIIV